MSEMPDLCYLQKPRMLASVAVQSPTRTNSQYYFVHRHPNNTWYKESHLLIGTSYLTIIASNEIIYEVSVENPHNWFQLVTELNLNAVTFIRPRTTSLQNYGIILTVDSSSSHKLRCFWFFQQSRWLIAIQTNICELYSY